MKKRNIFILLLIALVFIVPFKVDAFTRAASSYARTYYKSVTYKGTLSYSGGVFYEVWLEDPAKISSSDEISEKRAYCLDDGLPAPTIKITRDLANREVIFGGPACALIKYPDDSSIQHQHNRIVYIKKYSDSTSSCGEYKYEDGNCNIKTTRSGIKITDAQVVDDTNSSIGLTSNEEFNDIGDYYVASINVSKSGKISSYNITFTGTTGAFVTDNISSTSGISSSSASTLYVKVPKSSVTNVSEVKAQVTVVGKYTLNCKYTQKGLIKYSSGNSKYQRVAYPTVDWYGSNINEEYMEKTKSYSKTADIDLNISGIVITKVDSKTYRPLSGAKFGLYSDSSCTSPVQVSGTDLVGTTDSTGKITFAVDAGTYYVKELVAPSGYQKTDTCKSVKTGSSSTIYNSKTEEQISQDTKLTIKKVDSDTGNPLQGSKFNIYKENQTTLVKENLVSNADGIIEVTGLAPGIYYLLETEAPEKYVKQSEMILISLIDEYEITIENFPIKVKFVKRDKLTEEILAGAQFKIFNEKGEEVHSFTTSENYEVVSLPIGKYKLVEYASPEGYVNSNTELEFEIDSLGYVAITSDSSEYYGLFETTIIVYNDKKEEPIVEVPKTGGIIQPLIIITGFTSIGAGACYIYYSLRKEGLKK